jgi:phosphoglycerate dehydrogenase-like enzyme
MPIRTKKPRSIFILGEDKFHKSYNAQAIAQIQEITKNDGVVYTPEMLFDSDEQFDNVEIVFSGWGAPVFDAKLLKTLPTLKAVFYAAGSVRYFVTDAFWQRDIKLTSAFQANAIPVSEYVLAATVFALKNAWASSRSLTSGDRATNIYDVSGVYKGSRVGIISLGAIGQLVCKKLATMNVDIFAYDPLADNDLFMECGATRVDSLEQIFSDCDVVSLHAPLIKETEGMVSGQLLRSMPKGSTFINTARGSIVNEVEMIEALQQREDLFAVIDVITDEREFHKSILARLPNVFITPHIAGSLGRECHRMGALAVEECRRHLEGEAPLAPITNRSVQTRA